MATATKKKSAAPVRRKRSTGTTAKKAAPKKAPAKKVAAKAEPHPIEYTDEGFQVGSDSALIAEALAEGGLDRKDVNELAAAKIKKANGLTTRTGNEKYVPSMVSSILSRMLATGEYEIQSTWQLVKVEKKTRGRRKK